MKAQELQNLFAKGTTPKNLDGFYEGKLELLIPKSPVEFFGKFVSKFYLPWYGKEFNKILREGNNLIPSYLLFLMKTRYRNSIVKTEKNRLHVFPFKTRVQKGLVDNIEVTRLDYDRKENPTTVRKVIDELVCIDKNKFLGKAFIKTQNDPRLVAFFCLTKTL